RRRSLPTRECHTPQRKQNTSTSFPRFSLLWCLRLFDHAAEVIEREPLGGLAILSRIGGMLAIFARLLQAGGRGGVLGRELERLGKIGLRGRIVVFPDQRPAAPQIGADVLRVDRDRA